LNQQFIECRTLSVSQSKTAILEAMMSAQKTNQEPTSTQERQQDQRTALARRSSAASSSPALWLDPLDIFNVSPISLFRRMQDEMSRAFSTSNRGSTSGRGDSTGTAIWAPAIEVSEQDGQLVVSAELPGLSDEDVTVEISDDAIVIQGERQEEREESDRGVRRTERRYGQFYRLIPLPDGAKSDQARAEFVNGILRISVPLEQVSSNRRQIPIQTSSNQSAGAGSQSSGAQSGGQGSGKKESTSGSETPAQKAA
jgi:HSP20 family protein